MRKGKATKSITGVDPCCMSLRYKLNTIGSLPEQSIYDLWKSLSYRQFSWLAIWLLQAMIGIGGSIYKHNGIVKADKAGDRKITLSVL